MKKIISLLFLCTFFLGFSQNKELTIDDAVLGYYKGLYPSSLQNLKWINNSSTYTFQKNNELIFTDAKSNKIISSISLNQLQKTYPALRRFPRLLEITVSTLTFRNGNTIEV